MRGLKQSFKHRSSLSRHFLKPKSAMLFRGFSQNHFDLCVKFPRYFESIAVPIGSKIGGHPVIRDTHAIWALLNEDGYRRIRASVNNMLHHFLHDQRIARNDAENSWLGGPIFFLENLTVVEPRKLHKPVRLSHRIHYFFHFGFVLRRREALAECSHIRMTDLRVDSGNHRVKGLGGNDIDPLDVNFLNAYMHCLSFCCWCCLIRHSDTRGYAQSNAGNHPKYS